MSWVVRVAGASQRVIKRSIDLLLSAVMLILATPVWLPIAIAIRLDSPGPVLFRQQRWGAEGSQFTLLKFRSMHAAKVESDVVVQATVADPRVTRVGRFLRATGLDELPQLVNIIRGDMSFVGPRALAVGETIEVEPGSRVAYEDMDEFTERLSVPPGLTGLATIYLPKDAPPARKFEVDLRYVREWSVWLDLKLIVLSFWISFRGQWETREPKL